MPECLLMPLSRKRQSFLIKNLHVKSSFIFEIRKAIRHHTGLTHFLKLECLNLCTYVHNIMYAEPLTKTSVEILVHLSSKIRESFTVRQIANAIGKDYKISHVMTMRLAEHQYIIAEKKPPVTYCKLNLKGNSSLLAYIEGVRANRFFAKNRDLKILVNDILSQFDSPFFTLIIFGSYVKGTASRKSDLDVLFIIPDTTMEKEVSSAIGSIEHISPIGLHEIVLTSRTFADLLKQKTANVAWEAVDNRIVPYGAEALFKMLEATL